MGFRQRPAGLWRPLSLGRWSKSRFPYTDRPVRQHRPALVIAAGAIEVAYGFLWVLMITSAGNRRWDDDIVVSHLGEAGLPAPSVIRCAKIATIAAQGAERIGVLARSDRGESPTSCAHPGRRRPGKGEAEIVDMLFLDCGPDAAYCDRRIILSKLVVDAGATLNRQASPIPARKYGRASSDIILQASGRLSWSPASGKPEFGGTEEPTRLRSGGV